MTNFTVEQTGTAEIDTGAYPPEGVASNKTLKFRNWHRSQFWLRPGEDMSSPWGGQIDFGEGTGGQIDFGEDTGGQIGFWEGMGRSNLFRCEYGEGQLVSERANWSEEGTWRTSRGMREIQRSDVYIIHMNLISPPSCDMLPNLKF